MLRSKMRVLPCLATARHPCVEECNCLQRAVLCNSSEAATRAPAQRVFYFPISGSELDAHFGEHAAVGGHFLANIHGVAVARFGGWSVCAVDE